MMAALVLGFRDAMALLDMAGLVPRMSDTLRSLSRGGADVPLRQVIAHPEQAGSLGWMPAIPLGGGPFGGKVISVYKDNPARGLGTHQGVVVLFAAETGEVLAIVDAYAVTARRTAAASAVATDLLARRDAAELAILGSGAQAEAHVEAMLAVRPIGRVRVASRSREHAERFARRMADLHGIPVLAADDVPSAVAGADVICSVTDARAPIVDGAWIQAGAHLNAVGASVPGFRELDVETVRRARLYVDSRPQVLAQADDVRLPLAAGEIPADHILGEIGEVLLGTAPGRTAPDDVTLFKSVGVAVEDIAAASYCLERAEALGAGTRVAFGR